MARSYAKVLTSIWRDPDFTQLPAAAQRTYLLLLSQPDLSPVGVVTVAERRLADLAPDTTVASVRKAVAALHAALFVVFDQGTSELWIRSFLNHDGVLTSPNVMKAAARSFAAVHSTTIRDRILEQIPEPLREGFLEGFRDVSPKGLGELLREPLHDLSANRIPHTAIPNPAAAELSSSSQPLLSPTVDDETAWIQELAAEQALGRLDEVRAAGRTVTKPQAWLATTTADVVAELRSLLELIDRERPGLSEVQRRAAVAGRWGTVQDLCGVCEMGWVPGDTGVSRCEACTVPEGVTV